MGVSFFFEEMVYEERYDWTKIRLLAGRDACFALYRLPGGKTVRGVEAGRAVTCAGIGGLDARRGFVIAPFCEDDTHPVVVIEGGREFETALPDPGDDLPTVGMCSPDDESYRRVSEAYASEFARFKEALTGGCFPKLVLARREEIPSVADFSAVDTFLKACRTYPDAFVYLCRTPLTGMWLGSSPEILLSGDDARWQVVALAGTMAWGEGPLPEVEAWSGKNRREQRCVADYIDGVLRGESILPQRSATRTVRAGRLVHLKTDFYFDKNPRLRIGRLLERLHPTPAVCGLPKEEARRFILREEVCGRGYYSGFVGWIDPERRTDLYVNLRCMELGGDCLRLYAGGGLLPESECGEEWRETENKLRTMKRVLTLKK